MFDFLFNFSVHISVYGIFMTKKEIKFNLTEYLLYASPMLGPRNSVVNNKDIAFLGKTDN